MKTAKALSTWFPLLALPTMAAIFTPPAWPRWVFMWLMAGAIFAGCKWLTWRRAAPGAPTWRHFGYLLAWPGMDAPAFLGTSPRSLTKPPWGSWLFAGAKLCAGILLILVVVPRIPADWILLRGWSGMLGIVFVLHFGAFHLLSLLWRALGVNAKPLMNWPVLSRTLSEFWSERWNTAFRDLTHRFLFRPLTCRIDARMAVVLGFLCSGAIHELVISLPAGGGYGGPMAYFVIQAPALLLQRSPIGRRLRLSGGLVGWAFTMLILAAPVFLLFPPPFVRMVVVPFVDWLAATAI